MLVSAKAFICHRLVLWGEFLDTANWRRISGLLSQLLADDMVLLATLRNDFQVTPEWFAVEMRISTSRSEATVHSWKRVPTLGRGQVAAPSRGVQVYLGFVLKRGELGKWQADWCSLGSSVGAVLVRCGEETSVKVSLSVYRLIYVLWSQALSSDWKNKITSASDGNEFSPNGVIFQP